MDNQLINISVIIPVYNTGNYLRQCIESLDNQKLSIEIIIIDDGSTDDSGAIADELGYKDRRIKVIHQDNQGPSAARNCGIEKACGEYIFFLDSDDWIKEGALDYLYGEATKHQAEVIMGNARYCFPDRQDINPYGNISKEIVGIPLTGKQCFIELMKTQAFAPMVYNYIIRRDYLKNHQFRFDTHINNCEDELWTPVMLGSAQTTIVTDFDFYCYRQQRENSLTNNPPVKKFIAQLYVAGQLWNYVNSLSCEGEEREYASWLYVNIYFLFHVAFDYLTIINDSSFVIPPHNLFRWEEINPYLTAVPRERTVYYYMSAIRSLLKYEISLEQPLPLQRRQVERKRNNKGMYKRKILFCTEHLDKGGVEKLLVDVLRNIDYELFDVDLYLLYYKGVFFDDLPQRVNIVDHESCKQVEYDVEVAFMEGLATRTIALRKSNAVKIAWEHIDMYAYNWSKVLYKNKNEEALCYSLIDQVVFVSNAVMLQFDRFFSGNHANKRLIYNLFDKDEIVRKAYEKPCLVKKTKLTLCSIGRLEEQKAFYRLILILFVLKQEGYDFHYWIFGDGSQKQQLESLIKQLDLENTVFLMGFQKDIFPFLKEADIFVSASMSEGLSLVVGEAMCLGKPILATNVSGSAEFLDNGNYGMIVESDDKAILDGLKIMMSDETLRNEYAKKALAGTNSAIFDRKTNIQLINDLLYHTQSQKTPLEKIVYQLFADNYSNRNPGLVHGKMGKAIFFFHYCEYTGNDMYKEYANDLIDELLEFIYEGTPVDYENGLAGIGVGIEYLAQHQFIDCNTNEVLEDFDERLYGATFNESVADFSLYSGYMGIACYWKCRLCNLENRTGATKKRIKKALDHALSVLGERLNGIEKPVKRDEKKSGFCDERIKEGLSLMGADILWGDFIDEK